MAVALSWSCDFCKKFELVIDLDGEVYCGNCRKGYGKDILGRKIIKTDLTKEKNGN